eukprot:GILK01005682.1.p1 GENE.GILK01005682.1~~GILK01005682.1.p1  ORF type:complete len:607 (+),score=90.04 GILK01005682.1:47-1867(+)
MKAVFEDDGTVASSFLLQELGLKMAACTSDSELHQIAVNWGCQIDTSQIVESAWDDNAFLQCAQIIWVKSGSIRLCLVDSGFAEISLSLTEHDAIFLPAATYVRMPQCAGVFSRMVFTDMTCASPPLTIEEQHGKINKSRARVSELVTELCRLFYTLGWVSGTGGSISIRHGNRVYMAPSGVQKERMMPADIFVLDNNGDILRRPEGPYKLSECCPLFYNAFRLRNAGACIHTHAMDAFMCTLLYDKEFHVQHMEMIKGIAGHGFHDSCVVPIIENTAREMDLADSLAQAIESYPRSNAVLVRRHGVYVWGKDWIQAKTQCECYHYLFEAAVKMRQHGMDPTSKPAECRNCPQINDESTRLLNRIEAIVLDIEGTTTPLSFVSAVLFPFAAAQLRSFLESSWDVAAVRETVLQLYLQARCDLNDAVSDVVAVLDPFSGDKAAVLESILQNVQWQMSLNRKTTALKRLQGLIWHQGYQQGVLKGQIFEDVVPSFQKWTQNGLKIYIYSSGSIDAQKLLFGYSEGGDLTSYLSGYFDTTTGAKVDRTSYEKIASQIKVEPSRILFATDMVNEARAAATAGFKTVVMNRVGNSPQPDHPFPIASSFEEF